MVTRVLPPAVALVPGFFGFDHRGEMTYFADRFVAGLRSVLEAHGISQVPVLAVSTLGIGSLRRRQADLLAELRALESPSPGKPKLGGPRAWHLIGHSTGGVDAALLLRESPLEAAGSGSSFGARGWGEWAELVERVRSVTSIAAPHFGTGLAESPLARFAAGHPTPLVLRDLAKVTLDLARRDDLESRIRFALSASPGISKMPFFWAQMLLMNQLAEDLRPQVSSALSAQPLRAGAEQRMFSVATVAPRPAADHPDKLFRDLWQWTHQGSLACASVPHAPAALLDDPALRLPSQRKLALPKVDEGDSDGVVTSQRQILGELVAVVIGDHVDVLGRYRRSSLIDDKIIDPGLLTSGAEFGDDEFFGLLSRMGERIAQAIKADADSATHPG
jgi:pimeloyl-ACP methyl ester carboxylesterase